MDAVDGIEPAFLFDPDLVVFFGDVAAEVGVADFFVRFDLRGVVTSVVFEICLGGELSRAVPTPEAGLLALAFAVLVDFLEGTDIEVAAFLVPLDWVRVLVSEDSSALRIFFVAFTADRWISLRMYLPEDPSKPSTATLYTRSWGIQRYGEFVVATFFLA